MRLGISSYAMAWSIGVPGYTNPKKPMDAIGLLYKAKECNLEVVQFADNIPLHKLNESDLELIKETAKKNNIDIEIGTRGTDPAHLFKYLELAIFFQAKLVRTIITYDDMRQAKTDLQKVLPAFEKAGVVIGVENHDRHTTSDFIEFLTNVNHPNVGVCIDTVNSFGALEGPRQVIKALSPYIVNIHFKDFEIKRADHMMGFILTGTPAGNGMLKAEWLLDAIKGRNELSIILELWPPFTNSVEETIELERQWVDKSIDFFKTKLLNKV